jgi:hypothetical protein
MQIADEGGLEWGGTLPRAKDAGSYVPQHHRADQTHQCVCAALARYECDV